jgi:multicomponent Na+:H+ antiporter subunit G
MAPPAPLLASPAPPSTALAVLDGVVPGDATAGTVLLVALAAAGVFFSLVAVVGFYRLPDVYARTHAASKSETLGALLALSAAAIAFGSAETPKLLVLALFVLVTGPTAAHAVVRSAADAGIEPWTRDGIGADGVRTDGGGVAIDRDGSGGSGDPASSGGSGAAAADERTPRADDPEGTR